MNNVSINNTHIGNTNTTSSAAGPYPYAAGLCVEAANNVSLSKIQVQGNMLVTEGAGVIIWAVGIDIGGVNNVAMADCQVSGSTIVATDAGDAIFYNFGLSIGGVDNFSVTNSQFMNLSSTFSGIGTPILMLAHPISVDGSFKGILRNCQLGASSNSSTVLNIPMLTNGIDISGSADIVVEDSVASGNSQTATNPPGMFSMATGFKVSLSSRAVFRRCIASNNTSSSPTALNAGLAFGFSTTEPLMPGPLSDQIVFDSCIAEGNKGALNASGGFDIRGVTNSKVLNCVADGNIIGILVSENPPCTPTPCPLSSKNLFTGNTLLGNTQFGIHDTTASTSNSYFANRAQDNGTNPLAQNYVGASFSTSTSCPPSCPLPGTGFIPVRFWVLPGPPCTVDTNCITGEILDNISIAS